MPNPNNSVLALDVGERRIGVAIASLVAKLPRPLTTIENDGKVLQQLEKLVKDNEAGLLVIGLPRGLNGQETAQTAKVRQFASGLSDSLGIPVVLQDEALTSRQAEAELQLRGISNRDKAAIDSLAATYILEDYLRIEAKA